LQIIRGSGKSYLLLKQLSDVVAAVKVRDLTGPPPTDIMDIASLAGSATARRIFRADVPQRDSLQIRPAHRPNKRFDRCLQGIHWASIDCGSSTVV
jgi:hypothetical protein